MHISTKDESARLFQFPECFSHNDSYFTSLVVRNHDKEALKLVKTLTEVQDLPRKCIFVTYNREIVCMCQTLSYFNENGLIQLYTINIVLALYFLYFCSHLLHKTNVSFVHSNGLEQKRSNEKRQRVDNIGKTSFEIRTWQ